VSDVREIHVKTEDGQELQRLEIRLGARHILAFTAAEGDPIDRWILDEFDSALTQWWKGGDNAPFAIVLAPGWRVELLEVPK
jgi:hypothetical protein